MSQFSQVTNNSSCPGVQPADQLQCNVMPCDFCSLTNCAGQVAPVHRSICMYMYSAIPARQPGAHGVNLIYV